MHDVFLSCRHRQREEAEGLSRALQEQGWSVWWDRGVPSDDLWADESERALSAAGCVVVLWSSQLSDSEAGETAWVRDEAILAAEKGKLIPVLLDGTPLPVGLDHLAPIDLSSWTGGSDHTGLRDLSSRILRLRFRAPTAPVMEARERAWGAGPLIRLEPAARLSILVVDDEEQVCQLLAVQLAPYGFSVSSVTDPREAIPAILTGDYQLVLLDVEMPELRGVPLLKELRAQGSDVCVIIMTGFRQTQDEIEEMRKDAFARLVKPFEPEDLLQHIDRAIRRNALSMPESQVERQIGMRIRALREWRSVTLEQLGGATHLSPALISDIETGRASISVGTLSKLTTALGVSLSSLLEDL